MVKFKIVIVHGFFVFKHDSGVDFIYNFVDSPEIYDLHYIYNQNKYIFKLRQVEKNHHLFIAESPAFINILCKNIFSNSQNLVDHLVQPKVKFFPNIS